MSIPQYQEFMNPALQALKDGQTKHIAEIEKTVASLLHLTKQNMQEFLPSRKQSVVRNRLNWALYYMYRAGLLSKGGRGFYTITQEGKNALSSGNIINKSFLKKYKSFTSFLDISHNKPTQAFDTAFDEDADPTTRISNAIEDFNKRTRQDLLDQLKQVDPIHFERICLELMKAMGYGDEISLTPKSHDGGIDGIINEDALGLDKIYLQAKRYTENKVTGKEMRDFLGGLTDRKTKKGVLITTSDFDKTALETANRNNIIMIAGNKLTALLIKYNVGVRIKETYEIKEVDWTFFTDEEESFV